MNCRGLLLNMTCFLLLGGCATTMASAEWRPHTVRQLNGAAAAISHPAKLQIVTEQWNRIVRAPYLVYMPEKDRLLMSVGCDHPFMGMLLSSEDHGATWSKPCYFHVDGQEKPSEFYLGLTYLDNGKVVAFNGTSTARLFSSDYGQTWERNESKGPSGAVYTWDPPLVLNNPSGGAVRLAQGGYRPTGIPFGSTDGAFSQGCILFSQDEGRTWGDEVVVPQWLGANEVNIIRAKNSNWVAACRTDLPKRFCEQHFDHFGGLGVSISKDNGQTWTKLNRLYEWGRHHPSMVLMPNGDIVMSYVVRLGYNCASDGFPQFGIEAVVSHDNGQTWDLDHRYLLHTWVGNRKGPEAYFAGSQSTSSVLLPDGAILTAFGTGYRQKKGPHGLPTPRDVGLVLWRLGDRPINDDRAIRDAPFDSDFRNVFDPVTGKHVAAPGMKFDPRTGKHSAEPGAK